MTTSHCRLAFFVLSWRLPPGGTRRATDIRNLRYDRRWAAIHQAGVPVVSVGNLTAGGTGKTPTVAWLVNRLKDQGAAPGILSRGYQSLDGSENDEKRLLDKHCPGIPHVQNRDRVSGARQLVEEQDVSVVVLDDGFQHRRLHRDFDLVLIDALNPFGYGHLLPRGLLRERMAHLRRADALFITRCESSNGPRLETIQQELSRWSSAPIFQTEFQPTRLVNRDGMTEPLDIAASKAVFGFCGIGNPQGFRRTLASIGAPVSDDRFRSFPDHYHYTESDLSQLAEAAIGHHAELFLTTQKDLVKLPRPELAGRPVYAVEIALKFRDGEEPLLDRLGAALAKERGPESCG